MNKGDDTVAIACSLDVGSLEQRVGEWRDLVVSAVDSVEPGPTSVRFVLQDGDDALLAAVSLGQREKRCCAFFEVSIELCPDRRVLALRVPDGAEEALAQFVAALELASP